MRKRPLVTVFIATFLLTSSGLYAATGSTPTNAGAKTRLAYCGSIPNGASLTIVATTRLFIFLPKDLYPHLKLNVTFHGATAFPAHNDGSDGYAQTRYAKTGCWSHYFDFELVPNNKTQIGTVDIGSKSAFKTVSSYLIHFKVVVNPPSATKQVSGNGTVFGHVILGPVCPVEHIPPDPACAPKPYKTTINIWSMLTGSTFGNVATDASGSFKLSLEPGTYGLAVAQPSGGFAYPRCTQVNISVTAKKAQNVTISCDTGIR